MKAMLLKHPEYTSSSSVRVAVGTWNVNGGKHFRSIAFKHEHITDWLLDLPKLTLQSRPGTFGCFGHFSLSSPHAQTFPVFSVGGPFLPDDPGLHAPSFHCNFGLRIGRFPSILISTTALMFSVSSLLLTCPNHSCLLLLITITICSTLASSKIPHFSGVPTCSPPHCPSHQSHLCCCHTLFIFK